MKLLAVQDNKLYTPSILLFATGICFFLSTLYYKDVFFQYSYIFGIANLILSLRVFTIGFDNLQENISSKRVALTILNLGLSVSQIWLSVNSIRSLTISSYPQTLHYFLLLASIPFFVQLFISSGSPKLLKPAVFYSCLQASFYLFFVLFGAYPSLEIAIGNQYLILIQQFASYVVLSAEIWLLILVIRRFVKAI
jgi:uncharacterized membrane protein YgdD (TMEM256/DUF423 family)